MRKGCDVLCARMLLAALPYTSSGPLFIAQEEGLFAAEGFEVESVRMESGSIPPAALAQDEVEGRIPQRLRRVAGTRPGYCAPIAADGTLTYAEPDAGAGRGTSMLSQRALPWWLMTARSACPPVA